MTNPYDQSGGMQRQPGSAPPFDPNKGVAIVVAILTTLIAGPYVANYTSPFMHDLFIKLYGAEFAGFITGIWEIGMYILVGLLAQIFVYTAVLFIVSYAGMRLLPAML